MSLTSHPPASIDPVAMTVTRSISIAAPVAQVWAALTEPDHIARWFSQAATLDGVAVGDTGVLTFDGYGDFPIVVDEVDPPHVIAYRWSNYAGHAADPVHVDHAHSTVFRFTLADARQGTDLTVVESGFGTLADPTASLESNRSGWTEELDELIAYLEGRR